MWAWKWAWSAILRERKKIIYKWVLCEENMDRPSIHQGILPTLHTIYISNQEETERYCRSVAIHIIIAHYIHVNQCTTLDQPTLFFLFLWTKLVASHYIGEACKLLNWFDTMHKSKRPTMVEGNHLLIWVLQWWGCTWCMYFSNTQFRFW